MSLPIIIVGGGIGGLACAVALGRVGHASDVFEQAGAFTEIGAGLQLGPNAVRRLHGWGLEKALQSLASTPEQLRVRSAATGADLGSLALGRVAQAQYGAPYLTLHRADLHALLLQASQDYGTHLTLASSFSHTMPHPSGLTVHFNDGRVHDAACLIGADGLRSAVRQALLQDGPPQATGHLVFRCLVKQNDLPQALRCQHIVTWLGPALHVVQYPVRGSEWLNVAVIVQQRSLPARTLEMQGLTTDNIQDWDCAVSTQMVRAALSQMCTPLADLVAALNGWRVWVGFDREPVAYASQMAQGLTALLGDAAHPMRPYLAQGAGMAIEDAQTLSQALLVSPNACAAALQQYAQSRWARVAKVQTRAKRNGTIFHAEGLLAYARDTAMTWFGRRAMDVPWLYRG